MSDNTNAKILRWFLGGAILMAALGLIIFRPLPFLFFQGEELPYLNFAGRGFYVILLCAALCVLRLIMGPKGADRVAAMDIFGILIVGLSAILAIPTGRSWYIDIGIAWALQSFISTLALSKYLEGKGFDE
jgi:multicomponent Na+:H+ antiporter subunit F